MPDQQEWRELVYGCVLAGGQARRMGGVDKTIVEFAGKKLALHSLERLSRQTGRCVLNANGDHGRFQPCPVPIIADHDWSDESSEDAVPAYRGPLAGILAGICWAAGEGGSARFLVSAAADTPFFPENLSFRLLERAQEKSLPVVIAGSKERRHPVFALWSLELAAPLADFLSTSKSLKIMHFISQFDHDTVYFNPIRQNEIEIDPFFNINTPAHLDEALCLFKTDR